MRENIYLTGFMGSGKTTAGRHLAELLGRKFVDMDDLLVKRLKMPISDFFARNGEGEFRREEGRLLAELAQQSMLVVSTGGGIIEAEANRKLMKKSGRRVFLMAKLDDCADRLSGGGKELRPLWQKDHGTTEALFFRRMPYYSEAELTVDTTGKGPEAVAATIRRQLYKDDNFAVRMEGIECPVVCSFNALDSVCSGLTGRKVAILTDRKIARLHLPRYLKRLEGASVIELPGGERIKTLRTAEKVYKALLDKKFNRDDLLLAVGGGTVTDLGAYVASTYKRGMPFILASTTLLGCVDAAVGGKAAVNFGEAKNVIGTFTIPELVVLDAGSFSSLPRVCISDGLVEAYKTGLVETAKLATLIEDNHSELMRGDLPLLKMVAAQSAQAKARVVSADFRESGRRAILNFGHTFGHAIEGYYKYRVSHGQSVALGMVVATLISRRRGLLTEEDSARIVQTVRRISPVLPELPPLDESLEIMSHDKKIRAGKMVFILLQRAGKPVIIDDLGKNELKAALRDTARELK